MRLSILLPTHNRADVLSFAIESVLEQTFADYELLIVGDGCTDDTADVVTRYTREDKRVRWFDLPKSAHYGYANRNIALREARGDLIGFMAHDDVIAKDHFSVLVNLLADPAAHLGHSSAAWLGSNGHIVPTVFHLNDVTLRNSFLSRGWNRLPASCFIHRREAFAKVGMWDETLSRAGDMDLWSRILLGYGMDSLRATPLITTFHFRAVWRTPDVICPDNEPSWVRLHAAPGRLSPWLKVPVPESVTEQEALSQWLRDHPQALEEIRHGCAHALMTHAWDMERDCDRRRRRSLKWWRFW